MGRLGEVFPRCPAGRPISRESCSCSRWQDIQQSTSPAARTPATVNYTAPSKFCRIHFLLIGVEDNTGNFVILPARTLQLQRVHNNPESVSVVLLCCDLWLLQSSRSPAGHDCMHSGPRLGASTSSKKYCVTQTMFLAEPWIAWNKWFVLIQTTNGPLNVPTCCVPGCRAGYCKPRNSAFSRPATRWRRSVRSAVRRGKWTNWQSWLLDIIVPAQFWPVLGRPTQHSNVSEIMIN